MLQVVDFVNVLYLLLSIIYLLNIYIYCILKQWIVFFTRSDRLLNQ